MDRDIKIAFTFKLDAISRGIILNARVALHHSTPHYKISGIQIEGRENPQGSVLPDLDIKCLDVNGSRVWVHVDSGKQSLLGDAIGLAIEETLQDDLETTTADG
ncbi:hypothetical protein Q4E93_07450 [Flavitalea sp. BT771]|uniref:hypothetical protein n=1 Tax=Flavitalea sp. BT771 TaxID=3063329 RepID=UPI0026E11A5C|nr:hypothetical protein [Flavitalea sp. BT771]MDO6430415.1 hypothetical protein [Flavitalea sp. BT771]MDV6219445.1 hypothetical protein [Flavitalea sp. BT771]